MNFEKLIVLMFVVICVGCSSQVTPDTIARAQKACSTNDGLLRISVNSFGDTEFYYCVNGATFYRSIGTDK